MSKRLLLICIGIILILSSCSSINTHSFLDKEDNNIKQEFIPFATPNLFTSNFSDISSQINEFIGADEDKIRISQGIGSSPTIDIMFALNGDIMTFDSIFIAPLVLSTDSKYCEYKIGSNFFTEPERRPLYPDVFGSSISPITGLDIYGATSSDNILDSENSITLNKMLKMLENVDFETLISRYAIGNPEILRLTFFPFERELYNDSNLNVWLIESKGNELIVKNRVSDTAIKQNETSIWMDFDNYFSLVIAPYYEYTEGLYGCYQHEVGQNDKKTYIANNIIIVFFEK